MKILHTSDWHLGHVLYKNDRVEEQQAMLDQMVKIVKEEKPDLFLISGDVFHTAQPSAEAQKMFNETIVKLHKVHPDMVIVATAGNHDSGVRHEAFQLPWEYFNAHMVGTYDSSDDPRDYVIPVADKGYVIALPFVNEFYLKEDTFQRLIDAANEMNTADLPIIFSAHTAVRGIDYKIDFAGHENSSEENIGGITTINVDALGSGYDYLALGHIHKPQFVSTGKHNVRYSGTPLDVSFDENYKEPHSVTILEIDRHGETLSDNNFRFISIENIKPLVTLPAKGAATLKEAEQLLQDYPDDIPAYVRLNVNDIIPDHTKDRLKEQEWMKKKKCILCCVNDMHEEQTTDGTDPDGITVQTFKKLNPIEIAKRYAKEQGKEFGEDLQELFNQVINIVNEEERQA